MTKNKSSNKQNKSGCLTPIIVIFLLIFAINSCTGSDSDKNTSSSSSESSVNTDSKYQDAESFEDNAEIESKREYKREHKNDIDTANTEESHSELEEKESKSKEEEFKKKEEKEEIGKLVTLSAGTYEVGKNIVPGRYVIKANNGAGNLTSTNSSINTILTAQPDPDFGVTSYTTNLTKGMEIKISSIPQTTFTPVTKRTYQTELGAGTYEVGKDIKPGRYKIVAVSGTGNLTSKFGSINEILGTDDSDGFAVKEVNENLKNGQEITTTLERIKLIAQ